MEESKASAPKPEENVSGTWGSGDSEKKGSNQRESQRAIGGQSPNQDTSQLSGSQSKPASSTKPVLSQTPPLVSTQPPVNMSPIAGLFNSQKSASSSGSTRKRDAKTKANAALMKPANTSKVISKKSKLIPNVEPHGMSKRVIDA